MRDERHSRPGRQGVGKEQGVVDWAVRKRAVLEAEDPLAELPSGSQSVEARRSLKAARVWEAVPWIKMSSGPACTASVRRGSFSTQRSEAASAPPRHW